MVRSVIERTGPEVAALFGLDRLDFPSVLLVGMFWSDGWVVEIEGRPTCFIAVEMLEAPLRAQLLLPHEVAHIAHERRLGEGWAALDSLACGLFLEGLATLASARIVPGHEQATYLWAGLARTPQGTSVRDWLAQCEASWPAVRSRLLANLSATDQERIAPYFWGDRPPPDQPLRVGYFVGFRLVSALARERPIAELARWPAERVQAEVVRALAASTEQPPPFDQET